MSLRCARRDCASSVPAFCPPASSRRPTAAWMPLSSPARAKADPVTALECMASGVPLVSTSVGMVRDAVQDRTQALIVPANQPAALAEALERLYGDPDLGLRLQENALALVRERYLWEHVAPRYGELYRQAAAGEAKPSPSIPSIRSSTSAGLSSSGIWPSSWAIPGAGSITAKRCASCRMSPAWPVNCWCYGSAWCWGSGRCRNYCTGKYSRFLHVSGQ